MSNIPKLRFKEFSGVWEERKIGKIFKVSAGGDIKSKNVNVIKTDEFKYPIYANAEKAKGLYGYANLYKSEGNVITIAGRGVNIGIAHARKEPFYPIVRLLVLNPLVESNIDFWEHQLNQLNLFIESTGVPQLTAPQISSYKVKYPSKQEQEMIASFLSSVDTKIEQLTKKEELLKQYKKGVMQKIFSQEIRFKADDGSEFPEWEEKKFGDIYIFINTNSFSRALMNHMKGSVKNIHYGDIHTKYRSNFYMNKENVPFINDDVDISKIKVEQYCQVKDLVIADASEDYKDIGKTIELIDLQNEKLLAGLHTYIARDKNDVMSLGFAGYLMQTYSIRKQIMKLATGVSVLGISKNNLLKVKFLLPTKEEQTKIVSFLSSIDNKIEQVQKQLEATKVFKKGLLQQMFV